LLSDLPIELFVAIRNYLFQQQNTTDINSDFTSYFNKIQEDEIVRSWRSFLSVSLSPAWTMIRKHTMIWTLHSLQSERYLIDEIFKSFINDRMINPSKQLHLSYDGSYGAFYEKRKSLSPPLTRILCLEQIHTLTLVDIQMITHLGDMNSLKELSLINCYNMVSLGQMETVTSLQLEYVLPNLLYNFRWEQIEKLLLKGFIVHQFVINRKHFRSLSSLSLEWTEKIGYLPSIKYTLPSLAGECVASLRRLELIGFRSFDLTGLINLQSLSYWRTRDSRIIGRESIFPRLKRLHCKQTSLLHEFQVSPVREFKLF
jgi:hypothetical protein